MELRHVTEKSENLRLNNKLPESDFLFSSLSIPKLTVGKKMNSRFCFTRTSDWNHTRSEQDWETH